MDLFLKVLVFVNVFIGLVGSNVCTDKKASSCDECIAIPNCAWCFDPKYADSSNVFKYRCNLVKDLLADGCPNTLIANPKSKKNNTKDDELSTSTKKLTALATQIKPQKMDVKLRPGDPVTIRFAFRLVEDYPVDLYYLLDLSSSMNDDLTVLRSLGNELGKSMANITKDLQMGFGSFVDKTLVPYIFTSPERLENPCQTTTCAPVYSFHNDLPLTRDIDEFVVSVNGVGISSNIDHPEGGFDALMQAIVCTEQVNWRANATHLLVFSTDAAFHMAGDGRLAGAVIPNDGRCHLNSEGSYEDASREMDYPSVGHLVEKINEHKIQPIFAVTSNVVETFQNLQAMIPKSAVGKLTSDSSNIINLIEDAYNDLKGKIIVDLKAPKEITISNTKAYCINTSSDQLECDNVTLLDTVNFEFAISSETCLSKPAQIRVSVYGYNDVLDITVMPECECDCEETQTQNNCSGHGDYLCGACVCEPGFIGWDCSCVQEQTSEEIEDYIRNCTDPLTNNVCNGLGDCQCGDCICRQRPGVKVDGEYCQCDNTTCGRVMGKICNDVGTCNCGKCQCNEDWSGDRCECTLNTTLCLDTSDSAIDSSLPCNGNGVCNCGLCECNEAPTGGKYGGAFCGKPPLAQCDQYQDCVQCLAFQSGKYSDESTCTAKCSLYNLTILAKGVKSKYTNQCNFPDDCTIVAYFAERNEDDSNIVVEVEPEQRCLGYVNPLYLIIGIIAAIVGIGLAILLIWKLLTSIKDAREYKNFQKESQNAKWQAGENPIYKKATSTFRNPMYTGGKSTGSH